MSAIFMAKEVTTIREFDALATSELLIPTSVGFNGVPFDVVDCDQLYLQFPKPDANHPLYATNAGFLYLAWEGTTDGIFAQMEAGDSLSIPLFASTVAKQVLRVINLDVNNKILLVAKQKG